MKIGYPCINNSLKLTSSKTFRLRSYSEERLKNTISENLKNLAKLLEFGWKENLLFFRIGSGLVPFGSHPICTFDWPRYFRNDFMEIGKFIKSRNMRVSMHPDQFTLINALNPDIVARSVKEIEYHAKILDLMKIDWTHKIQIHVGGGYGDKTTSIQRFIENYEKLRPRLKTRLVIENDERLFSLKDCININKETGVPVILDVLHHQILNNGETIEKAKKLAGKTWRESDGVPMIDYSNQAENKRIGAHSESIDLHQFSEFLSHTDGFELDIMFEIKNKEKSAMLARNFLDKKS